MAVVLPAPGGPMMMYQGRFIEARPVGAGLLQRLDSFLETLLKLPLVSGRSSRRGVLLPHDFLYEEAACPRGFDFAPQGPQTPEHDH